MRDAHRVWCFACSAHQCDSDERERALLLMAAVGGVGTEPRDLLLVFACKRVPPHSSLHFTGTGFRPVSVPVTARF